MYVGSNVQEMEKIVNVYNCDFMISQDRKYPCNDGVE